MTIMRASDADARAASATSVRRRMRALQQFATGGTHYDAAHNNYRLLPAEREPQVRRRPQRDGALCGSKVLTRPDLADIRNFIQVGIDQNGNTTATAGNPYLKPATRVAIRWHGRNGISAGLAR